MSPLNPKSQSSVMKSDTNRNDDSVILHGFKTKSITVFMLGKSSENLKFTIQSLGLNLDFFFFKGLILVFISIWIFHFKPHCIYKLQYCVVLTLSAYFFMAMLSDNIICSAKKSSLKHILVSFLCNQMACKWLLVCLSIVPRSSFEAVIIHTALLTQTDIICSLMH